MRMPVISLFVSACLCLSGCMSGSPVDALDLGPSDSVTTSSIARPDVPVGAGPSATVEALEAQPSPIMALAEEAPTPSPRPPAMAAGTIYGYNFKDAEPIDFGKNSPRPMDVHGVDVSRWQGDIDWAMLRRHGANFAYIKATDGADHMDPMFMQNWRGAASAGIRRGAYHFFYWCSYASAQADWFIRNVPKVEGALPPVLDVEWNHHSSCKKRPTPAFVREKMQVFLDRLEAHYGQRPIIYTSPDFYERNLKGQFTDYPFWLRSVAVHPSKLYPGREWLFWQYSGSGLSKGVGGRIDLNVFHGDEATWWRWLSRVAPRRQVAEAD